MARFLDELLDEHAVVAEAVARLVAARREAFECLLVVESDPQALATTAGRGLDHHRVADPLGDLDRVFGRVDRGVVARDRVDLGGSRELLGRDLVAHRRDRRVLWPDEDDALFLDLACKRCVLRQEAVARVHRLGAGFLAGGDDLVHHQVRLAARRRPDAHGLVGELDMQRVAIGLGIDRDGRDAHLLRGLDDAARDLASICDQDLAKHDSAPSRQDRLRALRAPRNVASPKRPCGRFRLDLRSGSC